MNCWILSAYAGPVLRDDPGAHVQDAQLPPQLPRDTQHLHRYFSGGDVLCHVPLRLLPAAHPFLRALLRWGVVKANLLAPSQSFCALIYELQAFVCTIMHVCDATSTPRRAIVYFVTCLAFLFSLFLPKLVILARNANLDPVGIYCTRYVW